jgi:DNA invertase Pin-like site-specific DNA recombinase
LKDAKTFEIERNPNASAKLIGYARVSTEEQSLDMQINALERAGVEPDDIFVEKVSGAASKRPKLTEAIADLRPGDVFVVWKLDRVGRSMIDLLRKMQQIDDAGAKFKSLTEQIDTGTPVGNLLLHVLGAVSQFERDLITERTRAGVKRAQERGVRFGQPPKMNAKQIREAQLLRKRGERVEDIAKLYNVSKQTIYVNTAGLTKFRKKPKT